MENLNVDTGAQRVKQPGPVSKSKVVQGATGC